MERLDESSFDAIVVGTGLTESVVAAALARVGKRVLHLDALPFYGASHATLPLASFRDWLQLLGGEEDPGGKRAAEAGLAAVNEAAVEAARRCSAGEAWERDATGRIVIHDGTNRGAPPAVAAVRAVSRPTLFSDVSFDERLPPMTPPPRPAPAPAPEAASADKGEAGAADATGKTQGDGGRAAREEEGAAAEEDEDEDVVEGWEELQKHGRRFNLDLTPKLHLSSGALVTALLSSGVGRYLEFVPLKATLMYAAGGALERVPMSKAEIFQSKSISPLEKR
eukprot:CAMPEP_0180155486 /NCGR_PEP_ID=MMETSP0986-20121125/24877_1 /TAXON_ID=697907 /ORGANISM="non described non described, Strain CCMP2293" /LENGTH=280 /DNA_ID=CAMNT_0022104229 /DNA_START=18 /DNA_END=857 /DNA_ORIENTATION=+